MADLSHLLGAVYGDDAHDEAAVRLDPAPVNHPPEAPDWADDERLDAAFATWTPGPHPEAPAAERAHPP